MRLNSKLVLMTDAVRKAEQAEKAEKTAILHCDIGGNQFTRQWNEAEPFVLANCY